MATFSFNVKDAIKPEMISAVCANYGYDPNNPAGETQELFVNRIIKQWLHDQVIQTRRAAALANVTDGIL